MSFFFRYRRITAGPTLVIAAGYFCAFETMNNSLYKFFVDSPVLNETRRLGLGAYAQPVGTFKNRDITYK
jgi:hypothetical protein